MGRTLIWEKLKFGLGFHSLCGNNSSISNGHWSNARNRAPSWFSSCLMWGKRWSGNRWGGHHPIAIVRPLAGEVWTCGGEELFRMLDRFPSSLGDFQVG